MFANFCDVILYPFQTNEQRRKQFIITAESILNFLSAFQLSDNPGTVHSLGWVTVCARKGRC